MAQLVWSAPGDRLFETGVNRGVLFVDGYAGVAWNGLTAVDEKTEGFSQTPLYMDGVRYDHRVVHGDHQAKIEAFTYPELFELCDGSVTVNDGLTLHHQERSRFGLSYQTRIGNDLKGLDYGYKLHFVYNALATPSSDTFRTNGSVVTPMTFSWDLLTIPVDIPGFRPSAHFSINSTRVPPGPLRQLEAIIYGSSQTDPRLPLPEEIMQIFSSTLGTDTFSEYFEVNF